MSLSRVTEFLSPPGSDRSAWRSLKDFHAHHGVWALGVRVLRRWSIRAKVLLLLGIIAVPLVPLALHMVRLQNATVEASTRQMAALRLSAASSALGNELHTQWQAQIAGRQVDGAALASHHDELLAAIAQAGPAGMAVPRSWAAAQAVVAGAVRESGLSLASRAEATGRATQALLSLRREAVAIGGLVMTDDETLNRTAVLALETLPDLQLAIRRMRLLSQQQAQLQQSDSVAATAEQHQLLIAAAGEAHDARRLTDEGERLLQLLPVSVAPEAARALPKSRALLGTLPDTLLALQPASDKNAAAAAFAAARSECIAQRARLLDGVLAMVAQRLESARSARLQVFELLALCLLAASYLGYTFFLVMRGGLTALNRQMDRMARGDLSARPVPLGGDEVATTMLALTTSLARLSDLMASVRHGVSAVTQAAQQVALGNAELSARNRTAAQGLDGVSGSVQRYSDQLEACAREVDGVVSTVQALRLDAARNRKQTHRLRERLTLLRGRSREIADIVRLIDAIAFRTNILALNASIEASKAGEAGRGFAVVAQEVRSLAMRSADSARRIDEIVTRSTEDIERSGELADEAGQALAALDEHVDKIHGAMGDVATLTRQGEEESVTILGEVRQLKDSSAQNQRLVEQLASAADALRSQGERLSQGIGQFTLS